MTVTPLHELVRRNAVVLFDSETTGTDIRTDRILQIGAIRWDASGRSTFNTLVDPGPEVVISPGAIEKHGITREKLEAAEAPSTEEALRQFHNFVAGLGSDLRIHEHRLSSAVPASLVIAHNAPYDLGIWTHECLRRCLTPPKVDFICTLALAYLTGTGIMRRNKGGYPMLGTKLEEVAQALGLTLEGAHDAMQDIAMVELVLPALLQKAREQKRPILNSIIHREFLVRKGQTQPEWLPPRSEFYVVA